MNKDLYMKIGDVIRALCFCANKNLVLKCSFYFLQIKFKSPSRFRSVVVGEMLYNGDETSAEFKKLTIFLSYRAVLFCFVKRRKTRKDRKKCTCFLSNPHHT